MFSLIHSSLLTVATENVTSTDSSLSNQSDKSTGVRVVNNTFLETNRIDNSKDKEELDRLRQGDEELLLPERSSDFEDEIRSANALFSLFRNLLFFGPPSESLHSNSEESSRNRKHADLGELLTNIQTKTKGHQNVARLSKKLNSAADEKIMSVASREVSNLLAGENTNFHELHGDCAVPHPHHIQMLFLMHVPDHKKKDEIVANVPHPVNNPIEESLLQWVRAIEVSKQKDATLKTTTIKDNFSESSYAHSDTTTSRVEELTEENDDTIYVLNEENEILNGDLLKREKKAASITDASVKDYSLKNVGDSIILSHNATVSGDRRIKDQKTDTATETTNNLKIWNINDLPKNEDKNSVAFKNISKNHFLLNSGGTDKSTTAKISETLFTENIDNFNSIIRAKRNINEFPDSKFSSIIFENNSIDETQNNTANLQNSTVKKDLKSVNEININKTNFQDINKSTNGSKIEQTLSGERNSTKIVKFIDDNEKSGSFYEYPNLYARRRNSKTGVIDDSEKNQYNKAGGQVTKSYFLIVTLPTVFSKILYYVHFYQHIKV